MLKKKMLIFLTIIGLVAFFAGFILNDKKKYEGTLLGAEEIYPTVMVDNKLYQWHKGIAICDNLPATCEYYGQINHMNDSLPNKNYDFSSTFECEGEIYITTNIEFVYIKLNTAWLNHAIVQFDLIENQSLI